MNIGPVEDSDLRNITFSESLDV